MITLNHSSDENLDTTLIIDNEVETKPAEVYHSTKVITSASPKMGVFPMICFQIPHGNHLICQSEQVITVGRRNKDFSYRPTLDLSHKGREFGVSRTHAQIMYYNSCFNLMDLNSTNGTYINDKALNSHYMYPIKEGDKLKFGLYTIYVDSIR